MLPLSRRRRTTHKVSVTCRQCSSMVRVMADALFKGEKISVCWICGRLSAVVLSRNELLAQYIASAQPKGYKRHSSRSLPGGVFTIHITAPMDQWGSLMEELVFPSPGMIWLLGFFTLLMGTWCIRCYGRNWDPKPFFDRKSRGVALLRLC